MSRLFSFKSVLAAAIVSLGVAGLENSAAASHLRGPRVVINHFGLPPIWTPPCRYETVIDYEFRTIQYTECITRYTPCGRPYHVHVVRTKVVRVPVERLVKVCY
jgi:hypothetical protein